MDNLKDKFLISSTAEITWEEYEAIVKDAHAAHVLDEIQCLIVEHKL